MATVFCRDCKYFRRRNEKLGNCGKEDKLDIGTITDNFFCFEDGELKQDSIDDNHATNQKDKEGVFNDGRKIV